MNAARLTAQNAALPECDEPEAQRAREIIEAVARRIVARRLETAAVLFLEMHKPLAFLASQAAVVATPILGLFAAPQEIECICRLLGSQQAVESLIARIEALAAQRSEEARP